VFDKRPPRSPLPEPSPRKARPPSRPAARPRLVIVSDDDDDDDPLASAVLDSPLVTVAAPRTRKERKPAPMTMTTTGRPHWPVRRRGCMSTTQSGRASPSSKAARRHTLDEELRNSDGVTEEDLRALELDLEPRVYSAMASSHPGNGSRRGRGFLAHPHGAGREREDEDEDEGSDEVEIVDPPPQVEAQMQMPSPLPGKRRGRAAAVGTRRW